MNTCINRRHEASTRFGVGFFLFILWLLVNNNAAAQSLSFIKIVAGPSGNGAELGNVTLTTDQILVVHAAGYDAGGNYLGDFTVSWSVSGSIGALSATTGISTTFDATTPGSGRITADHPTAMDDESGLITVTVGAPHHTKILAGTSGNTSEVGAVSMLVNTSLIVHASSFDADHNRIADIAVDWSLSNNIGSLNPETGSSTTFNATAAGQTIIIAKHASLLSDSTGVIKIDLDTEVASSPALIGAPQSFKLQQNYPNPLHAGLGEQLAITRINYELPQNSPVKVTVHNLNGQLIQTLVDGQQNAGRYTVNWNGAIAGGGRAANGIYLLRMEAGRFTAMKKMVVAR